MTAAAAPVPGSATGGSGHLAGLDGLRGVAVGAVLLAHLGEFVVPDADGWLVPGGFLGVDVFFVLSGFLITGLLIDRVQRRGEVRVGAFWRRRLTRLLPALAVFAVGYLLVAGAAFDDPLGDRARTLAWSFALVSNWQLSFGVQPPLDLLHLWTLSVEAQFYLVAPLVALAVVRFRLSLRAVAVGVVAAVAASAGLRALLWSWWEDPGWVYTRTDARADAILIGVLLAVLHRSAPHLVARLGRLAPLGVAGLLVCAAVARPGAGWLFWGGFTLVAALAALVVAGTAAAPGAVDAVLRWGPLRLVGRASYSLYLWHLPIYFWCLRWSGEPDPWFGGLGSTPVGLCLVCLVLTAAVGTVSYLAVERPFLRSRPV